MYSIDLGEVREYYPIISTNQDISVYSSVCLLNSKKAYTT